MAGSRLRKGELPVSVEGTDRFNRMATGWVARVACILIILGGVILGAGHFFAALGLMMLAWLVGWLGGRPDI